ncbi:lactonase family protein [Persicitalea sp.]|uniref:lactonase family protein n=1 Tax=Persicitalea sp. TaxID=3100273 RepID=UPI0035931741
MKYFLVVLLMAVFTESSAQDKARFYVGTGAKGAESSITLCELDLTSGKVAVIDTFNNCPGPGYVTLSPDKKNLYSVNQDHTIAAFAVGEGGALTYLNSQPAEGQNPCHVSVHPSGWMAFLANYGSGSWAAYPLIATGRLHDASAKFQFNGSGPDKSRQEKPHAHCVVPSPNGDFVYVSDLGTDRLMNYKLDKKTGQVVANPAQAYFSTKPGAGPRHLAIHRSGKYLYLLNEMHITLTACAIDEAGVVTEIETVPTIPADFKGKNTSAAVRLHPNGKYVYVSNRGYNSVHGFEIMKDGKLRSVGEVREGLDTPRDFNFDPSGKFMVVGNQKTNDLTVYRVDPRTGKMTFLSQSISLKDPICFQFL